MIKRNWILTFSRGNILCNRTGQGITKRVAFLKLDRTGTLKLARTSVKSAKKSKNSKKMDENEVND